MNWHMIVVIALISSGYNEVFKDSEVKRVSFWEVVVENLAIFVDS